MSRDLFYTLVAVLCIKCVLLAADSQPSYFYGDSEAYLATATIRYIPPDRSFVYGLLLRRIAYRLHSLEVMVWTQVLLSAISAWLLSFALRKIFLVRSWLAAIFGILCSVEPLQLLAERYVLTECCANFLFVLHFVLALLYVKRGKLWTLVITQVIGAMLITFRISFLPLVLINSVLVPLLSPRAIALWRKFKFKLRWSGLKIEAQQIGLVVAHLCLSLLVSQGLLTAYKHWYGKLIGRDPALFYQGGAFLLSAFSPLIQPEDFPITSKRAAIFGNLQYDLQDVFARPAQHSLEGGLWPNIQKEFPNEKQANKLAAATAIHAVFRQPAATARLLFQTFLLYFNIDWIQRWVRADEGAEGTMQADTRGWLQNIYGISSPRDYQVSLTKKWHLLALPWYWLILCSLVLLPLLLFAFLKTDWPPLILCTIVALLFLGGATTIVVRPTPRYLTSAAWFVLLLFGLAGNQGYLRYAIVKSKSPIKRLQG
jgi:hypothetical protein